MCLIVVKPKGKALPTKNQMNTWFDGHPDGFGLAYPYGDGNVRIRKGAMTKKAMLRIVSRMKQDLREAGGESVDVMFHFRQATSGAVSPSNCHPFPLTKNQEELAATEIDTECAIAHNGIIGSYSTPYYYEDYANLFVSAKGKTDTQEFIEDYLVDLKETIHLPAVQKLIEAYSESKFALMTPSGVEYIGEFVKEEGWCYSNRGYKPLPSWAVYPDTYSFSKNKYVCSACERQVAKVYEMPDDDSSVVCIDCFTYYTNLSPEEAKESSYKGGDEQWF